MIYISAYTPHTAYHQHALALKQDLMKQGITLRLYTIFNTGTWWKNCLQKSYIIKQAFINSDEPIVWVDADATVKKYPSLFEEIEGHDIAVRYPEGGELLSGTMCFYQTQSALDILLEWEASCEAASHLIDAKERDVWDQALLKHVIDQHNPKIYCLPKEYVKIKPKTKELDGDFVIGHKQHSRKVRSSGGLIT